MQRIELSAGSEPLAGYTLIEPLGRGGYGEVWKAEAPGGFKVALKFVQLNEPMSAAELRALSTVREVRHPNLLTTFGSWQVGQHLIIAMELAERTLMERFREAVGQGFTGIPAPEILELFLDAARGLDYLNEPRHPCDGKDLKGIQHRDIKPQNLLIVGGCVKVADFGLARMLGGTATGHTGSMTPAYAAPEFYDQRTTSQSDQYCLAVTYCHLRGGRLPFVGSFAEMMAGHLSRQPDLSMLPEGERRAVARALAKDANDRWHNCREFVQSLKPVTGEKTATQTPGRQKADGSRRVHAGAEARGARPLDVSGRRSALSWRRPRAVVLATLIAAVASGVSLHLTRPRYNLFGYIKYEFLPSESKDQPPDREIPANRGRLLDFIRDVSSPNSNIFDPILSRPEFAAIPRFRGSVNDPKVELARWLSVEEVPLTNLVRIGISSYDYEDLSGSRNLLRELVSAAAAYAQRIDPDNEVSVASLPHLPLAENHQFIIYRCFILGGITLAWFASISRHVARSGDATAVTPSPAIPEPLVEVLPPLRPASGPMEPQTKAAWNAQGY